MPIDAINLKSDTEKWNEEVNRVIANRMLRNKDQSKLAQSRSNGLFRSGFASKLMVTLARAIPRYSSQLAKRGNNPPAVPTCKRLAPSGCYASAIIRAIDMLSLRWRTHLGNTAARTLNRRLPPLLQSGTLRRATGSCVTSHCFKVSSALFTFIRDKILPFSRFCIAGIRAEICRIETRGLYKELLAASPAILLRPSGITRQRSALSRAIFSRLIRAGKLFFAGRAGILNQLKTPLVRVAGKLNGAHEPEFALVGG